MEEIVYVIIFPMVRAEQHREGSTPTPGIVELDGAPPTKSLITHIAEGIINGREPIPAVPFDELIPRLERIADGGGTLEEYLEEIRQRSKQESQDNGKVSSIITRIKSFARHDNQVIVDGHQVGGKTTAIIAAAGVLIVGAGIYLRLDHAPSRPKAPKKAKEENESGPISSSQ